MRELLINVLKKFEMREYFRIFAVRNCAHEAYY